MIFVRENQKFYNQGEKEHREETWFFINYYVFRFSKLKFIRIKILIFEQMQYLRNFQRHYCTIGLLYEIKLMLSNRYSPKQLLAKLNIKNT